MEKVGCIILCVIIYLVGIVFSMFSMYVDEDTEEKELRKELGKRIFWPIYIVILAVVFIINFFRTLGQIAIGFWEVIKEDIF